MLYNINDIQYAIYNTQYHTFSCALQSYGSSRTAGRTVAFGLPSGPARLACWACLGLSTACLGLCTACPGPQDAIWTPSGRQLDANWAPIGRPKRLPVSTYVLRTPRQLPSPTDRLANSTFVAGWRHMQH